MTKTPVERRIEQLRDLWMQATQSPETRLLIWRIPRNAGRMMAAFFETQKHPGDWSTPDFFLHFDNPFETSFGYSRDLKASVLGSYVASQSVLQEQGIVQDWKGADEFHPDSAVGVVSLLASFAGHHQSHLRYLAAVFDPARRSSNKAFSQWLELALRKPIPPHLRIVLIDTQEDRHWRALAKRYARITRVIEAPIDMFDIARETAAQTGKGGPAAAYRQLLADVMTLLERGSAEQVAQRARHALRMTERLGWVDQKVVLHMAIAGAWMKEDQHQKALTSYKQARDCAATAESEGHPAGANMRMQSWFGEAGVWLKSSDPIQAAES
ncbi:MAG: hypothetical protein LBV45_06565, partial [Xanthomonadaceae bacterium]|nr:hypothetical protein [Xanthomonadaceae bacterium]